MRRRPKRRQGRGRLLAVGLTGSIGMGKSAAARALRRQGLAVHDADATVHRLLGPRGAAVAAVSALFPGVERDGAIDRQFLGGRVFGDPAALARLEGVLHPLVQRQERRFIDSQSRRRHGLLRRLVILDVPLLYEAGGEERCDAVILVSAPAWLQRSRVLGRPGMSPARFEAVLSHQMPDREKRRRADHLVQTGLGHRHALNKLRRLVKLLRSQSRSAGT